MAEEKLQYTLTLATKASGTGAAETAAALEKVAVASGKAEVAAKKAEKATTEGGKGMGKAGLLANQASFQVGDFFTQVEMGTSKMRAFSQQAPQLIGAFQMAGVVSGPLSLALAGVAVALPLIAMGVEKVSAAFGDTKADAAAGIEALKKFHEDAAERETKTLEEREGRIDREAESIKKLDQQWGDSKKAAVEYSEAVMENARQYEALQRKIAEALGLKVDKMLAIEQLEARQEEALQRKAETALKAEQDRLAKAEQNQQQLMDKLAKKDAEATKARTDLEALKASRAALNEKRRSLEADVANGPGWMERLDDSMTVRQTPGLSAVQLRNAAAVKARAALAPGGSFETEKAGIDKRIEGLGAAVKGLDQRVAALGDDAMAAAQEVDDVSRAVETKSAEIVTTLASSTQMLKDSATLDKGQALADELNAAVGTIQTTDARLSGVKEAVLTATADHQLSVDEMNKLGGQLVALTGGLQSGLATSTGNTAKLVQMMFTFQAQQGALIADIARLEREQQRLMKLAGSSMPAR